MSLKTGPKQSIAAASAAASAAALDKAAPVDKAADDVAPPVGERSINNDGEEEEEEGEKRHLLPSRGPMDLKTAIQQIKLGHGQIRYLLLCGGVWAADGAELLLIGTVTRALTDEWHLTAYQRGSLVSLVFVGVLLGNVSGGWVGDRLGRRLPVLMCYWGVAIFSLLSCFSTGYWQLAAFRVLVGASFGVGQPASNAMAGEISPCHFRMLMSGASQSLFVVGELFAGMLVWFQDPMMRHLNWRSLVVWGAVPSVVGVVLAHLWLRESPYYLHQRGRDEEAAAVLEEIGRGNGYYERILLRPTEKTEKTQQQKPLFFHQQSSNNNNNNNAVSSEKKEKGEKQFTWAEKNTIKKNSSSSSAESVQQQQFGIVNRSPPRSPPRSTSSSLTSPTSQASFPEMAAVIFGKHLAYSTFVTGLSCFTLNFLFYGGLYAFPQVLPEMNMMTLSPAMSIIFAAISELPGFAIGVAVGYAMLRIRGMLMYLAASFMCILLFVWGAQDPPSREIVVQVGLVGTKVTTSIGFIIVYVYTIEIYPTSCRSLGSAVCLAVGRLGAMACPVVYEGLTAWTSTQLRLEGSAAQRWLSSPHEPFFYLMAACCAVNFGLVVFLPIETWGRALPE